jgi:nucleotide-binding universal stress UspA family protein
VTEVGPDDRVMRRGVAAEIIAAEAATWSADVVVVGSHGKGWVERLLVGSATERLLALLPASLLVVPVHPAEQPAEWPRTEKRVRKGMLVI